MVRAGVPRLSQPIVKRVTTVSVETVTVVRGLPALGLDAE